MTSRHRHWESVYKETNHTDVGWYQAHPARSLSFLHQCATGLDVPIVDIGGGSSSLVDCLVDGGYTDVSVLDLSATALRIARTRLGPRASEVTWIEGDVIDQQFDRIYEVWHDRAAFHFLTDPKSQSRYIEQLTRFLAVGGSAMIATFALDGPERCSGLPVTRYGEDSLCDRLGSNFEPLRFDYETHTTPGGIAQRFLYGLFRKTPATASDAQR